MGRQDSTSTDAAARRTTRSSRPVVTQPGAVEPGPSGPSTRTTEWKCTSPRAWYSATLEYERPGHCRSVGDLVDDASEPRAPPHRAHLPW